MIASTIELDDPATTVTVTRRADARRLTLRVDPVTAEARVTAPPWAPASEIRMFLMRQADWLRRAQSKVPEAVTVEAGIALPVAGRLREVRQVPGRGARLAGDWITVGDHAAPGPQVAALLKMLARDALLPAVERHAAALGRRTRGLALRDTRSRWGSCSPKGALNFSWRLAMAPPRILDYVAAHEVAHLAELNHSPRFWAVVERLMPDYAPRRKWLKREGRELHRYRFEG